VRSDSPVGRVVSAVLDPDSVPDVREAMGRIVMNDLVAGSPEDKLTKIRRIVLE